MATPGPRAKSRTHGTSPWHERQRRAKASALARAEKQEARRSSGGGRPADPVAVHSMVQRAMGLRDGALPRVVLNWRPLTW